MYVIQSIISDNISESGANGYGSYEKQADELNDAREAVTVDEMSKLIDVYKATWYYDANGNIAPGIIETGYALKRQAFDKVIISDEDYEQLVQNP